MKRKIIVLSVPIAFGIACSLMTIWIKDGDWCIEKLEFVLTAIITCAATFSGFILTSVAILVGFSASPLMRYLRKNGELSELQCRYTEALILGLILIIFCVVLGGSTNSQNCVAFGWGVVGIGIIFAYIWSMVTTGYYLIKTINLSPTEKLVHTSDKPSEPVGPYRI